MPPHVIVMYKLFRKIFLLAVLLLPAGCNLSKQGLLFDQVTPSGLVSFDYQSSTVMTVVLPGRGGSADVSFSASGEWVARLADKNSDWCTLSPESGSAADKLIIINAQPNDKYEERKCVVSLFCDGKGATIIVKQSEKEEFSLDQSSVEIPAEGGTLMVTVSHTCSYSVSVSKDAAGWIIPLTTKGPEKDEVGFEVLLNPESTPREGSVTFSSELGEKTVKVIQKGISECIIVPKKDIVLDQGGGSFTVSVRSNVEYDVAITEGASWISSAGTKATLSDSDHTFIAALNPKDEPREGKIVFSNKALGLSETVTVKQKPVLVFSLTPDKVELDYTGGGFEVQVTSSFDYEIKSLPNWISPSSAPTKAPTKTHSFSARPNNSEEARTGNIVFSNSEGGSLMVTVTQKAREIAVDWGKAFYHQSLIMRFTATWCGFCPMMQRAVLIAQEQYPNKLIHVALHGGGSDLEFGDGSLLQSLYRVNGFPTGIVDGRVKVNNTEYESRTAGDLLAAAKQTEQLYSTLTGISLNSTLSGRDLTIDLTVYAKKAGAYMISVFLLEDGIFNAQSGAPSGFAVHNDVARIAVTKSTGEAFNITKDFSFKDFSYTVKNISSSYKLEKMKILVYVQSTFSPGNVNQSENYGNYYVDNCVTVPIGQILNLMMADTVQGEGTEGVKTGNDINL